MTVTKTAPLHVLRGILRRLKVKSDMINDASNSATRNYILEQYRASQSITSQEKVEELRNLAHHYYALKQDLAERERLQELDAGAEVKLSPKEMSRRAAARAGLALPDLNPDLEKDKTW
jgi:hypothetical protein